MLEFTGDAVYESEENEIMKTRQQRRSTLRPTCKRFAVYISSLGNYFFAELTNLLAAKMLFIVPLGHYEFGLK